jgi:hypothetical protein
MGGNSSHNFYVLRADQRKMSSFAAYKFKELRVYSRIICLQCDKPGVRACGSCMWAYYCSKECQLTNWREHKVLCKECKEPEVEEVRKGFQAALIVLFDKLKELSCEINLVATSYRVRQKEFQTSYPAAHMAWVEICGMLKMKNRLAEPAVERFLCNLDYFLDTQTVMTDILLVTKGDPVLTEALSIRVRTLLAAHALNAPYVKEQIAAVNELRIKHETCALDIKATSMAGKKTIHGLRNSSLEHAAYCNSLERYK